MEEVREILATWRTNDGKSASLIEKDRKFWLNDGMTDRPVDDREAEKTLVMMIEPEFWDGIDPLFYANYPYLREDLKGLAFAHLAALFPAAGTISEAEAKAKPAEGPEVEDTRHELLQAARGEAEPDGELAHYDVAAGNRTNGGDPIATSPTLSEAAQGGPMSAPCLMCSNPGPEENGKIVAGKGPDCAEVLVTCLEGVDGGQMKCPMCSAPVSGSTEDPGPNCLACDELIAQGPSYASCAPSIPEDHAALAAYIKHFGPSAERPDKYIVMYQMDQMFVVMLTDFRVLAKYAVNCDRIIEVQRGLEGDGQ